MKKIKKLKNANFNNKISIFVEKNNAILIDSY